MCQLGFRPFVFFLSCLDCNLQRIKSFFACLICFTSWQAFIASCTSGLCSTRLRQLHPSPSLPHFVLTSSHGRCQTCFDTLIFTLCFLVCAVNTSEAKSCGSQRCHKVLDLCGACFRQRRGEVWKGCGGVTLWTIRAHCGNTNQHQHVLRGCDTSYGIAFTHHPLQPVPLWSHTPRNTSMTESYKQLCFCVLSE